MVLFSPNSALLTLFRHGFDKYGKIGFNFGLLIPIAVFSFKKSCALSQ